jgi:hypothetical protein
MDYQAISVFARTLSDVSAGFAAAFFLAMVIQGVTEYLIAPLKNTPRIANWLVRVGLADENFGEGTISIWWIPYVTFAFGIALGLAFNVDIVSQYIPTASPVVSKILSAIIIGVGSNMLHSLSSRGK